MKKLSYNTRFYLKPTGLVMVRVGWARQKMLCYYSLSFKIDASKWNAELQRANKNTTHEINGRYVPARVVNEIIDETQSYIDEFFEQYKTSKEVPTAEDLKTYLNNKTKDEYDSTGMKRFAALPKHTFREVYEKFVQSYSVENNWSKNSFYRYKQMYDLLIEYNPHIRFSLIDRNFLIGWKEWLVEKGYYNNTINKQFRNVKCFLRWAKNNGEAVKDEIFDLKTKLAAPTNNVIYLTMEEVEHFAKFIFPENKQYLSRARDYFVFMCCTSLRYSDMSKLKIASVSNGFIDIYTQKTNDKIRVPLNDLAKEIFIRYSTGNPGEYLFTAPSNQKLNDFLKEAAKLAGLDREVVKTHYVGTVRHEKTYKLHEVISCHCGRRTFVCISLSLGIPASVVMSITGHSDYKNMLPYIAIGDQTAKEQMTKWNTAQSLTHQDITDEEIALKKQIIDALDGHDTNQLKKILQMIQII